MKKIDNPKQFALDLLEELFHGKYGSVESIRQIHYGYTNLSFLITFSSQKKFQVRIPQCGKLINRKTEWEVLSLIKDKNFVYFDKKTGIAVKQWIEGKNPIIPKHRRWKLLDKLLQRIKEIQQIKIPKESKLKKVSYDFYNKHLYHISVKYQIKFLNILHAYKDDHVVLSHTDINALNIIVDKKDQIHIIDFEWASLAPDYWDYANFIRESNINYKKADWSKYINNFDMKKLKEYIFASAVYAYLWTWSMPDSKKMRKYRKKTIKQMNKYARGVVGNEN